MTEEIKFLYKNYALLHFISVRSSLCTQFWLMLLVGIPLALLHLSVSFHKIITRLLLMIIFIWWCAAFIIIYRSSYEDHLVKSIDHCVQIRGSTNSGTLNPVSSRSPYTWYTVVIIVRKYRHKKKRWFGACHFCYDALCSSKRSSSRMWSINFVVPEVSIKNK